MKSSSGNNIDFLEKRRLNLLFSPIDHDTIKMIDERTKITDRDIQALADGELSPAEAKIVMTAVMRNPAYLERYENLIKQNRLLKKWWLKFRQEH